MRGYYFVQHNEIRFPYSKSNADRQRKRDYVAFESSFELTETQKNELSLGKSSIMYGFKDPLEHKADELRRYNPDMKLIFSFRHPIKRFVSWYNHFCIFFKVKSPCCTFLGPDINKVAEESIPKHCKLMLSRGYYDVTLSKFLKNFPRKDIKVLF